MFHAGAVSLGYGDTSMDEYKAFLLGPDGKINSRIDLTCDEATAREQAQQLADDFAVELWKGTQKIAEYPARRRPMS